MTWYVVPGSSCYHESYVIGGITVEIVIIAGVVLVGLAALKFILDR